MSLELSAAHFIGPEHPHRCGCPVCRKSTKRALLQSSMVYFQAIRRRKNQRRTGRGLKAAGGPRRAPVFSRRDWMVCRVWDKQARPARLCVSCPCLMLGMLLFISFVFSDGTTRETSFLARQVFHFLLSMSLQLRTCAPRLRPGSNCVRLRPPASNSHGSWWSRIRGVFVPQDSSRRIRARKPTKNQHRRCCRPLALGQARVPVSRSL